MSEIVKISNHPGFKQHRVLQHKNESQLIQHIQESEKRDIKIVNTLDECIDRLENHLDQDFSFSSTDPRYDDLYHRVDDCICALSKVIDTITSFYPVEQENAS